MATGPNDPIHPRQEWHRAMPLLVSIALVWLLERLTHRADLNFPQVRYLVAHSAFETVAMVLAGLSFALLWMAPLSTRRAGAAMLAAALADSAVLDFLHMLSYDGMPALVTPSGVEKGIAFWLAGRALETGGLLAMAFAPAGRRFSERQRPALLVAVLALTALSVWIILYRPQWLPRTYVPGQGLTGLKVGAELVLIALLLLACWRLQRMARRQHDAALASLAVAAALAAAGEVCFASYSSASDLFNMLGHVAKIGAYWQVTRAAYLLAVRQPLATAGGIADALQATLNPALICNELGAIRWVNPAFTQTTGLTLEALHDCSLDMLEVAGDEAAWAQMRAAMREGRAWKGQVQVRRRNGSVYIDDRSLTPMRGPQGHLNGFVMLGDDITERERVARELRANEERLRALLASAPDAIVVIDRSGRIQMANPATERMFGYSRDELMGRNVRMLMPEGIADQHDGYLQAYQTHGRPQIMGTGRDVQARRRDGGLLHAHLTLGEAHLPDGTVYIGFMRDVSERMRAEAALTEREERYRALMDTAMDGVWICDLEGRILAVNDAYCQRSGYSRAELLLMRVPDLEAELSGAEVAARIARIVERGHDKLETRHRCKSGAIWPVEITVSHWALGGGQLFVFARDLTGAQATALALRQSEERLQLALQASTDGVWDSDLRSGKFYMSPAWKRIVGYADAELANSREAFIELLHPTDALVVMPALADLEGSSGPERAEVEFRVRHKDGHWVPVLSRGQRVRDASGSPVRVVGTTQDLSERKRAEAALRENEDKLRNLFELSPLGIALGRADGKLIEFNEAYRALTGYDAETLRGLSYMELIPREFVSSQIVQLDVMSRTGRYGPFEKEYLRADGSRVPVRLNGVRIDIAGQPHVWAIVEDLTESRRVEAERQAMQRQQLQSQKLEALGHLTGGIAHDFNNMLAGIMGLASLGLERYITEPEGKLAKYLREIVRTSERGRDLVAKMLAYVRTEEPEAVAPRALPPILHEMCAMLRPSLPSSIALSCEVEEAVPAVRIPAVDVHQIIMNLVLNARDAVGQQGNIAMRLGRERVVDAVCSDCGARVEGEAVVLEVADDGCGIAPELLPKIFHPFFTTKEVGRGTGLGLASVVGLVHKAGGHMQVLDRLPRGTLMRVWLPAADAAPEPAVEPARAPQPSVGGPVWVVDDDPAVLVFLSELLREHGFRVVAFADPQQALQALGDAQQDGAGGPRPAVLITDQTMPRLSGAELAHAAAAVQPGLPVVLCTGYSEAIDAESARALGIRHFLRKPFDSRDLLTALAELLGRQAG